MLIFPLGTRAVLCASSGCGKGYLLSQILNSPQMFTKEIHKIIYFAPSQASLPENLKVKVTFQCGLPSESILEELEEQKSNEKSVILCIDDLQSEMVNSEICSKLFRVGRHLNCHIFACLQVLHPRGKYSQDIMQNCSGLFLLKSLRSLDSIRILSNQLCCFGDKKSLLKAYINNVTKNFDYIYISFDPNDKEFERFRTNIFEIFSTFIVPHSIYSDLKNNSCCLENEF
jgi:hypothetical protein